MRDAERQRLLEPELRGVQPSRHDGHLAHFVLQGGTLAYYPEQVYPDKDDTAKLAKSCLGTLHLANCSVRLPTDLKSKGKYQSTCFRLDLDPVAQATLGRQTSEQARIEAGRAGKQPADDVKTKYLLAAEVRGRHCLHHRRCFERIGLHSDYQWC